MRDIWSREETILAFNLYCKLPYGNFNVSSKDVQNLAKLIGRTPGAVAFKLVNFVSLDPKQKLLGRKGASNTSKLDKEIFAEFSENFDQCFFESEKLLEKKSGIKSELYKESEISQKNIDILIDETKTGATKKRYVETRFHQDYFRRIVLANYTSRCAITGICVPELLVASHIKPWRFGNENNRLNPSNGICLSAIVDRAFDKGLVTFDAEFKIVFSQKLKSYTKEEFYEKEIGRFENAKLAMPIKFLPKEEFLEYHRQNIFLG